MISVAGLDAPGFGEVPWEGIIDYEDPEMELEELRAVAQEGFLYRHTLRAPEGERGEEQVLVLLPSGELWPLPLTDTGERWDRYWSTFTDALEAVRMASPYVPRKDWARYLIEVLRPYREEMRGGDSRFSLSEDVFDLVKRCVEGGKFSHRLRGIAEKLEGDLEFGYLSDRPRPHHIERSFLNLGGVLLRDRISSVQDTLFHLNEHLLAEGLGRWMGERGEWVRILRSPERGIPFSTLVSGLSPSPVPRARRRA